jgi:hypothetical protein
MLLGSDWDLDPERILDLDPGLGLSFNSTSLVPNSVGAPARGSMGTLVSEDEGKADLGSSKFSPLVVPVSSPSDVVASAMGSEGL